ncbi:trypsin-like serine peptidase [Ensifer aridi]|uniref:trypsin-like serine peptidase n=1 Tax=Ensifer aridi TaxID=1708715 RepID=UPI000A115BB6|nr:serine protease [Ensifer aridi]
MAKKSREDSNSPLAAAERWRERTAQRTRQVQAAAEGNYTDADSLDRLAKRVVRLKNWVAHRHGDLIGDDPSVREVVRASPLKPKDVTDRLVERVIGASRDFLSIEYFERGLQAARCTGRVITNSTANGTGFLVAPDVVITNWHVLPDAKTAEVTYFELDYEANTFGEPKTPQAFDLDPEKFFMSDERLDFALIAVKPYSQNNVALSDYGHLPLIAEEGKITIGEPVNIVQHPKGRVKQITIRNSQLLDLPEGEGLDDYFHYSSDTERGTSGAAVMSDQWEVVALHHQGVPKTNTRGELVDADDNVLAEFDEERIVWVANEGIRTSRLVKAIAEKALPSSEWEAIRAGLLQRWLNEGQPGSQLVSSASAVRGESLNAPFQGRLPHDDAISQVAVLTSVPNFPDGHSYIVPIRIDISFGDVSSTQTNVTLVSRGK